MMKKPSFKVGDRIKLLKSDGRARAGMTGKIVERDVGNDRIIVSLDGFMDGHSCGGAVKDNPRSGWVFDSPDASGLDYDDRFIFDVIETPKSYVSLKYEAGTKIGDYVKKLLGKETDEKRKKWLRTFDNCVLPKVVRDTIDEALTVVLRSDVFEKWGINEHFEKGLTNSILIYGPPGTGKTMVSESIAAVLGKNLMKLTNADIQSNVPGRTEKNITESFAKAKTENAVIMMDECDSMLYNRNAVGAVLSAEINHLLGEIENFDGVVILTTNRLHKLDEALQRRIIAKVELPLPSKESRVEIWKKLIPEKMPTKDVDYDLLSEAELSGGEIKNSILLAARKAIAQNDKAVTMEHFQRAVIVVSKSKQDYLDVQPKRFHSVMDEIESGKDKIRA